MSKDKKLVCAILGVSKLPKEFLRDVRIVKVKNMDDLSSALFYKPEVFVLNSFRDFTKDEKIVSIVNRQSPETKIILYGLPKSSVKSSLVKRLDEVVDSSVSLKGLAITIEKVFFNAHYNETFNEEINLPVKNGWFLSFIFGAGVILLFALLYLVFDFF